VNTDPTAYRVLCFGDSNTHGWPPDEYEKGRLPADARWTGRLQTLLGGRYAVIEEGLNGRTVDLDYGDRPGCNGRDYLLPCLLSHSPLDLIVVMLGSNDIKTEFGRTAADVAAALDRLLDEIPNCAYSPAGETPAVLLVSPIRMDGTRPQYADLTSFNFDPTSIAASREFAAALRPVAEARGALFADAASVAGPGDDGLHLSRDSHQPLADLLAGVIGAALPAA
jgi:lysophospholipase L1-like esterase